MRALGVAGKSAPVITLAQCFTGHVLAGLLPERLLALGAGARRCGWALHYRLVDHLTGLTHLGHGLWNGTAGWLPWGRWALWACGWDLVVFRLTVCTCAIGE